LIPFVELNEAVELLRNGASIKQSDYAGGTPISRIETIANWNVNPERCGYADMSEDDFPNHILQDGDILISHINSTKHLGKCAMYKGVPEKLIHGMNLLCLRVNADVANPGYIYRVLSSREFRKQLSRITKNSVNQSSFTVPNYKALQIPLPSLKEQKRIAAILDKADAIHRKRQQAIDLTDQLLRSVFLDMFGDPVTNPKGWRKELFGNLGAWASGGTPSRKQKEYFQGDINWYSAGELNTRYVESSIEKITKSAIEESAAKLFKSGSILLGMYDTAAFKSSILKTDSACNQACANLDPNDLLSVEWFYSYISISKDHYLRLRRGVRQKNFNLGMIKEFELPLPPIEKQIEFEKICKSILEVGIDSIEHNKFTNSLFNSLVQKAFNGELTYKIKAA